MYKLSRTIPVNEPSKSVLTRADVWEGLVMKANNALPYVPAMQKCEVIEKGDGWLIRDILLNGNPLREKVVLEPQKRVIFERTGGNELGRIENLLDQDASGNLTLTFTFGLTKEGVPDGSEAETKHFSPMEGMYLGAVASTLAAVRRMVEERGSSNALDASGDNPWIYEFFRSADSLSLDRLTAHMTADCHLTFGNHPTVIGHPAFREGMAAFWSRVKGMSHKMTGAWSLHEGRVGIAESVVTYTRPDGTLYSIKACTVMRRRGDKIADLRIHADVNGL